MTEKPDNQIYPAEWVGLEGFLLNADVSWGSKSERRTPRLCLQDVQQDKPFKVKAVSFLIAVFFMIQDKIISQDNWMCQNKTYCQNMSV